MPLIRMNYSSYRTYTHSASFKCHGPDNTYTIKYEDNRISGQPMNLRLQQNTKTVHVLFVERDKTESTV